MGTLGLRWAEVSKIKETARLRACGEPEISRKAADSELVSKANHHERTKPSTEFLVICRGQWDSTLSRNEKQNVLDRFYTWVYELVDQGKMKPGQRLTHEGKTIGRKGAITDGPFGESKEAIGGYWSILAHNLEEAAQIAKGDPCLDYGLLVEIRPIDPQIATSDNTR
jgi:hypothetical protein